jgi:sugar phosphate isomerase/epimerase
MKIGFHTDAFNSAYWSFGKCLEWAERNDVHFIECGLIDGVSWIHGLGYQPHGVPYVLKAIPWAKHAGCGCVATTDGLHRPPDLDDDDAMERMRESYARIVEVAAAYEVTVNIEVHGYFTTDPDRLAQMLAFCDSPFLNLNLDTGNSFIAGRDPVAFCERFVDRIRHVHVKDVSESLAAAVRGDQTGIAVSQCAIGDGVNAANIRRILERLRDRRYDGVLSMECEGQGGPLIERSLAWLRATLAGLDIPVETC